MKESIPKEYVLKIIDHKLKQEELLLKNANTDFKRRLYSRSVLILRELKDIYEHCEISDK